MGHLPPQAGGGRDQPLAVLLEQLLVNTGPGEDPPATHAAEMRDAGEFDEIAIAGGVFCQENEVIPPFFFGLGVGNAAIDDIHLIANDWFNPSFFAAF